MSASIGLLIIFSIFLIGAAFALGIIEFSPEGGYILVQSFDYAKNEIFNLAQGKTTVNQSLEKANKSIDEVGEDSSKKFENVLKYAQNKITPTPIEEQVPEFDAKKIKLLVHELTNQERSNYGLSQLSFDSKLSLIAQGHSQDMANKEYFSHETPEGLTPSDRADKAGYSCQKIVNLVLYSGIAENIFQGYLFESYYTVNDEITSFDWNTEEEIAKITVDGWMNSPGHRENILTNVFDREGIGVEITSDHKVYVTQNFC